MRESSIQKAIELINKRQSAQKLIGRLKSADSIIVRVNSMVASEITKEFPLYNELIEQMVGVMEQEIKNRNFELKCLGIEPTEKE